MNWTQFIIGISGAYFFYYGINLVYDLLFTGSAVGPDSQTKEISFPQMEPSQEAEPVVPGSGLNTKEVISSGNIAATGGVNIKELFALAQSDLIQYTKAIPY